MILLQKKIRHYSKKMSESRQMPENYFITIKKSKEAFEEHEAGYSLSYFEFLYSQGCYIKKRWWILQGILLLFLWYILQISAYNYYVKRCVGLISPLFVILLVPELWKNHSSASMEIEGSTFYSLPQIHSARLLIFAGVDLFLLSLFFAMTAVSGVFLTLNFMIDFFIPFNITCCICFRTLCSPHICSETLTMALCVVWIAVWLLILLEQHIYSRIALPVWGGLLFFSFLYLVCCIRRSAKNYNLIWEAGTPWN